MPSLQYVFTPAPVPDAVSVRLAVAGQTPLIVPVSAVTPMRSGAADFYTLKVTSIDAASHLPLGSKGVLTIDTPDPTKGSAAPRLVVEGGRTFAVVSNLPGWESGGPVYWQVVLANVKA